MLEDVARRQPDGSVARKVVVTGGAGFIGSHLVERLLSESFLGLWGTVESVLVFDDFSNGCPANLGSLRARRLEIVRGDVRDREAVDAALQQAGLVYHLAARAARSHLDDLFSTNVVGTFNVLRAAASHGVPRVIFASSGEAYGEPMGLPVDESHPLLPISTYGATKAVGEALCRAFRREYGLHTVVLRLADVYGPRDTRQAIPAWLDLAAAGRELPVQSGNQVVDLVWIDDAVEALLRASVAQDPLPPINVASGTGTRILDLARRIAHLTNGRSRVRQVPPATPVAPAAPVLLTGGAGGGAALAQEGDHAPPVSRFVANVDRMRQLLRVEPPLDPLMHLPSLFESQPIPLELSAVPS